ncbi:DUF6163 family protein [Oryzifoliimicrobium ureilyticus]|uniref:DUF6163 family protein n=1 Tax=Oryzifoliimicrobium ureilyticus TaxID=3113724 RepID=UPI00307620A1
MEDDSHTIPGRTLTDLLFVIFLRMVALFCFWSGLQYWGMLVGYSEAGVGRFDLLSLPWRVASTSLAVVFPVASLGLWLTVSWGPVVWLLAAAGEVAMYGVFPHIYGQNELVVIVHGAVGLLYLVFRFLLWLEKRKRRGQVSTDLP